MQMEQHINTEIMSIPMSSIPARYLNTSDPLELAENV